MLEIKKRAKKVNLGYMGYIDIIGDFKKSKSCGIVRLTREDALIDAENERVWFLSINKY